MPEQLAIAPDVAKLVKSLVEEGVTKLADVTEKCAWHFKRGICRNNRKDVHDIIAGEYSEKQPTQNEITQKLAALRAEAKQQIGDAKGDATKINAIKSRSKTEIRKLEEQLASGNFEKKVKTPN
jgi:hypothetical protein